MILHQALLIAKCFLFCLLVIASTYGFGGLFLRLKGYSYLERLFFRCCLGIVVWSYSVFFLALCSALYTPSLIVLLVVSLWKTGSLIKEEPCTPKKLDQAEFMFAIALTVGSVPTFLIALYPAHTWDDIAYHLPSAALYIKHHSLIVTEYLRFPVFNEFAEMLFAAAFPFLKDIGAQLICWLSNVLVLVGIFAYFRGQGRARAGLIGAAVWLASDLALKLSAIAFVEIPLALLCWASVYSLLEAVQRPKTNNLFVILSGIFAGSAMATKYTALPMVFGIFCGLLLNEFAKTSFSKTDMLLSSFA